MSGDPSPHAKVVAKLRVVQSKIKGGGTTLARSETDGQGRGKLIETHFA